MVVAHDYGLAMRLSFLFYRAQRSGDLSGTRNPLPWRSEPSFLDDGVDVGADLSKGYFDAGDYVKYGQPAAYTMAILAWAGLEMKEGFVAGKAHARASSLARPTSSAASLSINNRAYPPIVCAAGALKAASTRQANELAAQLRRPAVSSSSSRRAWRACGSVAAADDGAAVAAAGTTTAHEPNDRLHPRLVLRHAPPR